MKGNGALLRLCFFAGSFLILVVPWPGFAAAYGDYFRWLGRVGPAHEGATWTAAFIPSQLEGPPDLDTCIALYDSSGVVRGALAVDSRQLGWITTALFIALAFNTPLPWPKRLRAAGKGVVCLQLYLALLVAIATWSQAVELGLLPLRSFWSHLLGELNETMVTQMGAGFVIAGMLWLILCVSPQRSFRGQSESRRGDAKPWWRP